jgi:hypothetical protein
MHSTIKLVDNGLYYITLLSKASFQKLLTPLVIKVSLLLEPFIKPFIALEEPMETINQKEFVEKLRTTVSRATQRHIWERAKNIAENMGAHKQEVHSAHMSQEWTFTIDGLPPQNGTLKIEAYTTGQFGNTDVVNIYYNSKIVFSARSLSGEPEKNMPDDQKVRVRRFPTDKKKPGIFICIETYHTGEWEQFLSTDFIKRHRTAQQKKLHPPKSQVKRDEEERPISDDQKNVASNFAIATSSEVA